MPVKDKNSNRNLKNVAILFVFKIFYVSAINEKRSDQFYILKATNSNTPPFDELTKGQTLYSDRSCAFQNCFITDDASYFNDARNFDAVLFNAADLYKDNKLLMPALKRSSSQKYIFVSTESAMNYPIHQGDFDGYFNWTWTYRLDSDVPFQSILVKDDSGQVIGPKMVMHWMDTDEMAPTSEYMINILRKKSIAAAWFVSNCEAKNKRLEFAYKLKWELNKYGERLDIYGLCGYLDCTEDDSEKSCYDMITRDYFFYLAFENSFCEDYVTEKLLIPLKYFAVPIVYGGANYTRFMPDGIYINARSFVPEELATEIVKIIRNKNAYYEYFKWHTHFNYSYITESHNLCTLCTMLNNNTLRTKITIYTNLSLWWNESLPLNLFEPEFPDSEGIQTKILDTQDRKNSTDKPTTPNSIKEFLSNVLQYYETI